jgi:hypothetical protein
MLASALPVWTHASVFKETTPYQAASSRKPTVSKQRTNARAVSRSPKVKAEIRQALAKGGGAWLEVAPELRAATVIHLTRHLTALDDANATRYCRKRHSWPAADSLGLI